MLIDKTESTVGNAFKYCVVYNTTDGEISFCAMTADSEEEAKQKFIEKYLNKNGYIKSVLQVTSISNVCIVKFRFATEEGVEMFSSCFELKRWINAMVRMSKDFGMTFTFNILSVV